MKMYYIHYFHLIKGVGIGGQRQRRLGIQSSQADDQNQFQTRLFTFFHFINYFIKIIKEKIDSILFIYTNVLCS